MPLGDGVDDIEGTLERLQERAEQRAGVAERAGQALATLTSTAESAGGAVRATVTASGRLSDLELGKETRRWAPAKVAQEILQCVRLAQARLAEVAADTLADGSAEDPLADYVVDRLRRDFPAPGSSPSPRAAREPRSDDEYFTQHSVRPTDEW